MKIIILISSLFLAAGAIANDTNLSQMLKDSKVVPHSKNGKVVGYKIVKVEKGSMLEKLGLKEGDIIKSINGQPVSSPSRTMELYSELK